MRIDRLRLQNFRQHERTELTLGPGLTGIVGPNGSGKTTLLEAIAWSLYGMPAARGGRDTIKRRGAGPRAPVEVELEFTLGPHRYRVVRTLTRAELFVDGDATPVANSLGTVTERVERLLGMNRDEFFNTYFTGQKELAVMAAMSPTERAQFLSRVLGYEKLSTARERNRGDRSLLRSRIEGLRSVLADPAVVAEEVRLAQERRTIALAVEVAAGAATADAAARLARVRPELLALAARRDRATALDADRRVAATTLAARQEGERRARATVETATAAAARLADLELRLAPLPALREEEQQLARAAEGMRDREALVGARDADLARIAQLRDELVALPTADAIAQLTERGRALREELQGRDDEAARLRKQWTQDAQEAQTKLTALRDQYRDFKEQRERLEAAGPEGLCPTCGRPLGKDYAQVFELLGRQMEQTELDGSFYKSRVDQLKSEPETLKAIDARRAELQQALDEALRNHAQRTTEAKRVDDVRSELAAAELRVAELASRVGAAPAVYDAARHVALRAELATLDALARDRDRAAAEAGRREAAERELAEIAAAVTAATADVARLDAERATVAFDERAFAAMQAAEATAAEADRVAQLSLARAAADARAAAEGLEVANAKRAVYDAQAADIAAAEADMLLRNELDRAFGDLRTDLNAKVGPELAALASDFLDDLTQGRYTDLALDEQYVATVVEDREAKPVISGGEEDVVNLALRLAVSQMIADRAGQPLSLLVLDEIFGSLDDVRRNAVLDLLRGLADRFPQVILITHIESVRDGFDRLVRVEYDVTRQIAVVADDTLDGRDVAA